MRIVIIALGSRGDVQPYIALGKGLVDAGHTVRFLTHENFEELVTSQGLDFWLARGNVQAVAESEEMRALLEKGNFIAITRQTAQEAKKASLMWGVDGLAACEGMELIIGGLGGTFLGLALAEKLDLQILQAYLVPFTPTGAFPSVLMPSSFPTLGGALNGISHRLTRQIMWQGTRGADNAMRKEILNLPMAPFFGPFNHQRLLQHPILNGYSPSVIPKPRDWDDRVHVTGYWFLDEAADWSPSPDLLAFLQADPKPLYIGFGSMTNRKPEETVELVLQALDRTQQRAVLLSGWGGLQKDDLPEHVLMVDSVPHAWLFPRVAAVVHHGGAGTTAAGFRAGVPSVIIPFLAINLFGGNGWRI